MTNLPNDAYAEQAVLGAMLIAPEALRTCLGSLTVEDFYEGNLAHRIIFAAMTRLNDANMSIDVGTVYNELINMQQMDNVGGLAFLEQLSENAIGLTGLEHYIKMIKDAYVLRQLLTCLSDIEKKYEKGIEGTVSDFIAQAGERIDKIVEQRRVSDFIKLDEYVARVSQGLATMRVGDEDSTIGISTGYGPLNRYTNGWQKDNMIILAARPSVGKTALALNFALTAAKKTKKTVAFFSLEMSGESLTKRLLAMQAEVDMNSIMTGKLTSADKRRIQDAEKDLARLSVFIDDTPSIKINDLIAKARKLQNSHNDLGLVVIDYIGLITSSTKSESRQIEVSEFSRKLKQLARTLKVPVLVLCQLSRAVDARTGKEPLLSDLRESGAIEQDADIVMLMSNATDKSKDDVSSKDTITDKALIKVDVAKNRNGQTGYAHLLFHKSYSRFYELSKEAEVELKGGNTHG